VEQQSTVRSVLRSNHVQMGERVGVAITSRSKEYWRQLLLVAALVFSDALLALFVWGVAYHFTSSWGQWTLSETAVANIAPSVAVWVGLRAWLGLYPGYGVDLAERLRRHTYSVFATFAVLAVFAVGVQIGDLLSRLLLLLAALGLLVLAPVAQYLTKYAMKMNGLWGRPVIVFGYKETGADFVNLLEREWELGYNPAALFDYRLTPAEVSFEKTPYDENLTAAVGLAHKLGIDTAIFAMPHTRREQLASLVTVASESFRHVLVIPNLSGITNSAVVARDLAGTFAVEIKHNLLNPWIRKFKRGLDVIATLVGGLLISPLLIALVVLIKLDSPGPAFHASLRRGAGGRAFRCWKFRTMCSDAETVLNDYLRRDPKLQAEWEQNYKLHNDPRITRVGHYLRKTSLDELPQLWNVLRGEMSLVGPRPILEAEFQNYGKTFTLYKRVPPGITGLWQVSGRSNTSYVERLRMNAYYVRNWSVWLDLVILARTIKVVLSSRGAC
jgi:Undecaprenyl-phosphate galactose phosphotransferase WbaP